MPSWLKIAAILSVHIQQSARQNIPLLFTVTLYKRVHFKVKQTDQSATKSHENKYFYVKIFWKLLLREAVYTI